MVNGINGLHGTWFNLCDLSGWVHGTSGLSGQGSFFKWFGRGLWYQSS